MKLYFAYYVPVDGEITWEMGEIPLFYYDLNNRGYLCNGKRMPNLEIKCTLNNGTIFYEGHGRFKQAKLHICSRDIEAGDKVRFRLAAKAIEKELECVETFMDDNIDGQRTLTAVIKDGDYLIYTTPDTTNQCYKVIGIVSPDATWIKEGMEFDQDEIEIVPLRTRSEWLYQDRNYQPYEREVAIKERYEKYCETAPKKVMIKGPCGHFH
jgi:hypothetical protein